MRLVIAMLAVRNTNLLQSVIRLTARTFNWLDLPKFLFLEVNCTYPIGGTPNLSNRRRQDGLSSSSRVGNTRWAKVNSTSIFTIGKCF